MRFINFTELYRFKCLLACSCVGFNLNPKLLNPTRWRFILLVIFIFYNTIVFACREIMENISRCINKQCWTRNICCPNGMHGSKNLIKICSSSFGQNSLFRIFLGFRPRTLNILPLRYNVCFEFGCLHLIFLFISWLLAPGKPFSRPPSFNFDYFFTL